MHLLSLLSSRSPSTGGETNHTTKASREKLLRSSLTRLAAFMHDVLKVNLSSNKPTVLSNNVTPWRDEVFGGDEVDIISSPVRRRKGQDPQLVHPSTLTPQKGARSKQRRLVCNSNNTSANDIDNSSNNTTIVSPSNVSTHSELNLMSTNFLGYRRLHLSEIVCLHKHDNFILVIPANTKREEKSISVPRDKFLARVISHVVKTSPHLRSYASKQRRDKAYNNILESSGIKRNGSTYIELPCKLTAYAHREDYITGRCSESDVKLHVEKEGAGLSLQMLQYPSNEDLLLRWNEVPSVQIWKDYWRGDERPIISLKDKKDLSNYANEMSAKLDAVKDDYIQMLELRLEFEKKKTRILERQLRDSDKKHKSQSESQPNDLEYEFSQALKYEQSEGKLQAFASDVDQIYKHAIEGHYYGGFQDRGRLVPETCHSDIYDKIKTSFPFHFRAISSIIFGAKSHQPSYQQSSAYTEKKKAIVNFFISMIRARDNNTFKNWAIIGTIAMWSKGVCVKHYRNPLLKTFSVGFVLAMNYLDDILHGSKETRTSILRNQPILHHASDNYQAWHSFAKS